MALSVTLPRLRLGQVFGNEIEYSGDHKPLSYFGFVALEFSTRRYPDFALAADAMTETDFAQEQLEQHFTICHVVAAKASMLGKSGWTWFAAVVVAFVALCVKG